MAGERNIYRHGADAGRYIHLYSKGQRRSQHIAIDLGIKSGVGGAEYRTDRTDT
jgi:hypothetical protein